MGVAAGSRVYVGRGVKVAVGRKRVGDGVKVTVSAGRGVEVGVLAWGVAVDSRGVINLAVGATIDAAGVFVFVTGAMVFSGDGVAVSAIWL